jgi:hypothetical protein
MDDRQLQHRINSLAEEEEQLWARAGHEGGLSTEDDVRLKAIQLQLDQAYDLLRQRSARRSAGLDPDTAQVRPPSVVEHYEQ